MNIRLISINDFDDCKDYVMNMKEIDHQLLCELIECYESQQGE